MRPLTNTGDDTLAAHLRRSIRPGDQVDLAVPALSVFGFEAIESLKTTGPVRLLIGRTEEIGLLGDDRDRGRRSDQRQRSRVAAVARWLRRCCELRWVLNEIPQGIIVVRDSDGQVKEVVIGSFSMTTSGLGLAAGNPMSFIQIASGEDAASAASFFDRQWEATPNAADEAKRFADQIEDWVKPREPRQIYALALHHLLGGATGGLDERQVVNAATGIHDSTVWRMLYRFQRDGVVGVTDKLNTHGGCILADSVGLGKTFEALAVIKYHELRNDRVLVLCPKRLRENWTMPKANDRRNRLVDDRFNYDVLNHTDLSRRRGHSGDIDLANLHWSNYDLVVIDESHNFRNKKSPKKGVPTRYDRLLDDVVRAGVKTRVLMLSATPVNNRLTDLRNQIAFAVSGDDAALSDDGIASIQATTRKAQQRFNAWLDLPEDQRRPDRLVDMLGFGYFQLLDKLTIARSRRHIERYYGTDETGRFPDRLPPINIKSELDVVDSAVGGMPPVAAINRDITLLHLAAFSPLKYLLPGKLEQYESKYATETSRGTVWRQFDRESSLISLVRINVLKRLESSIEAFRLTLGRQLADVEELILRIDDHDAGEVDSPSIADLDLDDPIAEQLAVGKNIKVLLSDMDRVRWRGDLIEDRDRLRKLSIAAQAVNVDRDAKLSDLKQMLRQKWSHPINADNRKVLVFTAFADTAAYLYEHLHRWAFGQGVHVGLLTGGNRNRSTLGHGRTRQADVLSAFAPVAKQRPDEFADEGELDLLIATDCISEGQNLQDCDWLVNYDIHWNPVRIIQRFGRIDRLGSPNQSIQLVNFWPNMQIEQYLDLESRVSGRMVLLDVSATGEENVIERSAGDPMNDLDYRRRQLLHLQDAVIDMDDLSAGLSIADLTLNDFRVDLADFTRDDAETLSGEPPGTFAAAFASDDVPAGYVFCLRHHAEEASPTAISDDYPLRPHYLVHVDVDGRTVRHGYEHARKILETLKKITQNQEVADPEAIRAFDRLTGNGRNMTDVTTALGTAIASITGAAGRQQAAGLFTPGANASATAEKNARFMNPSAFEVLCYLAILPQPDRRGQANSHPTDPNPADGPP